MSDDKKPLAGAVRVSLRWYGPGPTFKGSDKEDKTLSEVVEEESGLTDMVAAIEAHLVHGFLREGCGDNCRTRFESAIKRVREP